MGNNYFANWDEAWYADIVRNMVRTGNLLTPIWNHQAFFDKPPLFYWISILPYVVLKPELALRLISASAALLTGLILYLMGKKLFDEKIALSSLLILLSSVGFLYRVRTGNIDSLLTLFITGSIYSFFKAQEDKRWYLTFGLTIALGYLTKGVIAFLILALVVIYFLLKKKSKELLNKEFLKGILIAFAIPLIWIVASVMVNGDQFIKGYLFTQTGKFSSTYSFWNNFSFDFINFLRSGIKYWFVAFIPFLTLYIWNFSKSNKIIIPIYFFVFFSILLFSENKSNWFLVPLYPLVALVISAGVFTFNKKYLKLNSNFLVVVIFLVAAFIDFKYVSEYIVPDVAVNEVNVARRAAEITKKNSDIYMTNYYYPTTVYYSNRRVFYLFGDKKSNDWWIKPKEEWKDILKKERCCDSYGST